MQIKWLGHASFKIKTKEMVIYVDPYAGEYDEKADLILISHEHYDHFGRDKIAEIRSDDTAILTTDRVASELDGAKGMRPGDIINVSNVKIEAVYAYNIGKPFHPKGNGIGFIIDAEGHRIYFSGDSDKIPEMKNIRADIVLVAVGGTYSMNRDEAAEAVLTINPKLAIPMHFGSGVVGTIEDAELFKEKVEEKSKVKVRILEQGEEIKV